MPCSNNSMYLVGEFHRCFQDLSFLPSFIPELVVASHFFMIVVEGCGQMS